MYDKFPVFPTLPPFPAQSQQILVTYSVEVDHKNLDVDPKKGEKAVNVRLKATINIGKTLFDLKYVEAKASNNKLTIKYVEVVARYGEYEYHFMVPVSRTFTQK
ncbi:MAG: hypothetical protein PUB10_05540 [Clostridiales bacterium]|nr:hypothetical protein [Clostridiales bacterium]